MALNTGSRLGPYEIVAPLGAGGMGEVYRARDTRLDRIVAIKILPSHVAQEAAARQRFEREARAVSALNHPNICTLYDIGSENGVDYMVMECVEGENLADRIRKGALPLDQALTFAIQISDALDKAHRRGVVHRDLKPANIMVASAGVKILDFGLAKIGLKQGPVSGGSLAETVTTPLTGEGTILGTLQYMAPEQLEGKDADARTDIFAFGVVLYEMLTGRRAFDARSQAALISAIMSATPPPVSSLQPVAPVALDSLVRGCLEKEPEERWQSAHDVTAQLKWIAASGSQAGVAAPVAARRRTRNRALITAVVLLAALSAALGVWVKVLSRTTAEAGPVRFTIAPPEGETIAPGPATAQASISPDGRYLALATVDSAGDRHLWIRALGSFSAQRLAKGDGAGYPFWSPDSQSIAFFADGKLKRIAVSGGTLQTICDSSSGNGGAWNSEGIIVFAQAGNARYGGPLYRVPAAGGVATPVTALDPTREETTHAWPQFLPGGRRFLYHSQSRNSEKNGVYVQSLDSKERTFLLNTPTRAAFAPPGLLLFLREGTLLAQELDQRSLALRGEPLAVAEDVRYNESFGNASFSVSENGALAYRTGGNIAGHVRLVWHNREGKESGTILKPGSYYQMVLSPDEKRVAIAQAADGARADLWALEISTGIFSRLTFGPENATYPQWSPDSKRIAFTAVSGGRHEVHEVTLGGGARLIYADNQTKHLDDWTRDGRFLVYHVHEGGGTSLSLLALDGEQKPKSFLRSAFARLNSRTSPDGRWIAYDSNESGRQEVYVASFPSFTGSRQISTGGGLEAQWRADGKELYYLAPNRDLMVLNVKSGPTLETGAPKALFRTGMNVSGSNPAQYSVTGDGQRFLVRELLTTTGPEPVSVVLNWPSALKR